MSSSPSSGRGLTAQSVPEGRERLWRDISGIQARANPLPCGSGTFQLLLQGAAGHEEQGRGKGGTFGAEPRAGRCRRCPGSPWQRGCFQFSAGLSLKEQE